MEATLGTQLALVEAKLGTQMALVGAKLRIQKVLVELVDKARSSEELAIELEEVEGANWKFIN